MPRLIWVFAWRTVTLLVLSSRGSYSVELAIKLIIIINQSCGLVENSRDTERPFDCYWGGGGVGCCIRALKCCCFSSVFCLVFYKACYSFYPGPRNFSQQYWVLELFFGKNLHLPHKSQMVAPLAIWFKLSSSCLYFFILISVREKT